MFRCPQVQIDDTILSFYLINVLILFWNKYNYCWTYYHSDFHLIPGNPVKKVTLNHPEKQAVIVVVAIVMEVGIILMYWMHAIMLWKGSH